MKAGWFFCNSEYDSVTMELKPRWPVGATPAQISQFEYVLYDVRRLDAGPAPSDHVHQVMGTVAFVNDVLSDGHYHYIQHYGNSWHQVTVDATHHVHPFQSGGIGDIRFLPGFFCMFIWCANDALFDGLAASSGWYLIGESAVSFDAGENMWMFGDIDNTPYTQGEIDVWRTRFNVALGRNLPVEVVNPRILVSWFCPMTAPNMYDWWRESLFRPTSKPQ